MAVTMESTMTGALALMRFAEFAGTMTVLGMALFPFYALEPAKPGDTAALPAARAIMLAAALIAALAAFGWMIVTFVEVAGSIDDLADPATLSAFFFDTSFGGIWLLRLVAASALAIAALVTSRGWFARNAATTFAALLAGVLLASQAWIGHPVALTGAMRPVVVAAYVDHVLAAGTWIGGLPALGLVLNHARRGGDKAMTEIEGALHRFSTMGMIAVVAVFAGGLVNAISRLHSPVDLANSVWGRTLLVKILVFAALIVAASINRFVFLPRLRADPGPTMARLARSVIVEQALALVALAAAAWLGIQMPPA
ncbi:MAG TPA: CopD family protein [Beijerinckiaceae bacterium]|jgi:putative copper resistance protein D|nr:CopD family protein [Beijerinckiaceae bacterium]